jgi:hypothetical protein
VVGCQLRDLVEDRQGAVRVTVLQHLLAHRDQRLELRLLRGNVRLDRQLLQQLVERGAQLRFGTVWRQVRGQLALEHRIDGRDRSDLELRGDELVLVGIDLRQHHALVGIGGRDLLQHRRQRLARPAPLGPEIDDDELRHRGLDHVAAELLHSLLLGGRQS